MSRCAFRATAGRPGLTAIREVSFALDDGEVVALIGPSGCGKSTLLNIGSGLYRPSEGAAFVDGERVVAPNAHVAFMLQKDLLLPWRTVARQRRVRAGDPAPARARAHRAGARAARRPAARRLRRALSAPALGRHAPAGGAGAHARGRSVGAAARRAVLRGRRPDPHGAAARPRPHPEAGRQDRAADHPRSRRGRADGRPRAGDEPAARPHHRRDHDRHAASRRSDRAPRGPRGSARVRRR